MFIPRVTAGNQHFPGHILCSELRYLADDFQEHRKFSSLVSWLPPCTRVLCLSQSIHLFPVRGSEWYITVHESDINGICRHIYCVCIYINIFEVYCCLKYTFIYTQKHTQIFYLFCTVPSKLSSLLSFECLQYLIGPRKILGIFLLNASFL